ncbi:hypothetical protein Droror1_Dr00001527 [Drosera rotundifolia]
MQREQWTVNGESGRWHISTLNFESLVQNPATVELLGRHLRVFWVKKILNSHGAVTALEFRLRANLCYPQCSQGDLGDWVEFARVKQVQNLTLKMHGRSCPDGNRFQLRPKGDNFSLVSLRNLYLHSVTGRDNELEQILCCCPSLEMLELVCCSPCDGSF